MGRRSRLQESGWHGQAWDRRFEVTGRVCLQSQVAFAPREDNKNANLSAEPMDTQPAKSAAHESQREPGHTVQTQVAASKISSGA